MNSNKIVYEFALFPSPSSHFDGNLENYESQNHDCCETQSVAEQNWFGAALKSISLKDHHFWLV